MPKYNEIFDHCQIKYFKPTQPTKYGTYVVSGPTQFDDFRNYF